ncbi:hypothetical protein Tco_1457052, partial [Tanacetum coccineum]
IRIFKKKNKKKAKSKQIQAREGKDQAKSKSKVRQSKKIQLEGLKLPKPQVVLQKKKTRVKIAKKAKIAFKLYNLRGPKLPTSLKALFPASQNPVTTWVSSHTSSLQHPSQNHFIHPTKPPPSCISAMLAILHHSQVFSMAMIDSKEAQQKLKAGICFRIASHNKHTWFLSLQRNTEERREGSARNQDLNSF